MGSCFLDLDFEVLSLWWLWEDCYDWVENLMVRLDPG